MDDTELKLPAVSGRNLLRQEMTFPADFQGQINLVFIAFQQWQQMEVDSWVPLVSELAGRYPALRFYEFPTIQPMGVMRRTFINEGMRMGIPDPATRGRTITLYLDKRPFRRALDITDEDHIWLYLFDQSGRVLWRIRGAHNPERGQALQAAVADLLADF